MESQDQNHSWTVEGTQGPFRPINSTDHNHSTRQGGYGVDSLWNFGIKSK